MKAKEITSLQDIHSELEKDNVKMSDKYSFSKKNKVYNLSLGRIFFNILLPDDYPIIDEPVTKQVMHKVLNNIYRKYPVEVAADIMTTVNKEGFRLAAIYPVTIHIDDLIVPEDILEKKKTELTKDTAPEVFSTHLNKLAKEYISTMPEDGGIRDIVSSKASGKANPDNIGILQLSKGPIMDLDNNLLPNVTSSLSEGYDVHEYFAGAAGARRAYFTRSRGTAEPGTLARGTTYANAAILLDKKDCKTNKYLDLEVTEDIVKVIEGRFYYDPKTGKLNEITDPSKLLGKNIKLRSPLYCKSKNGICSICYGKLAEMLGTDKIGLIAGQVINAASQSFTMAARHQTSNVVIKPSDFTKDLFIA